MALTSVGTRLYLHAMGGDVFAFADRGPPVRYDSLSALDESSAGYVALLGTPENAATIAAAYDRWHRLRDGLVIPTQVEKRICVASPSLCRLDGAPADVLYQLEQLDLPGSVGGWRVLDQHSRLIFGLQARWAREKRITPGALREFEAHPLHRRLQFIKSLDPAAVLRVVLRLGDPRFHVDPDQPDSSAKLHQFFGLGKPGGITNAKAFLSGCEQAAGNRYEHAADLFQAWSGEWEEKVHRSLLSPRHFLMRRMREHCRRKPVAVALVRASTTFLNFLRQIWLEASFSDQSNYAPELFVPEHFFTNADEARAWREWFSNSNG